MTIEARDISKYYREGEVATKGLDGVSLTLEDGEFIVVSGPSGCGKSTLAKCLSLNEECDEGDLFLFGQDEFAMSEKEKRNLLSSRIAYIGENSFIESSSALDNVIFPLLSSGISSKKAKKIAKMALTDAGLKKIHRKVGKLSGGERNRVMIARAISSPHTFIFLDEPLANLDEKSRVECLNVLKEKQAGKMIFLISHLPDESIPFASRHIKMREGRIVSDERTQEKIGDEKAIAGAKRNLSGILVSLKLLLSKPHRMIFSFLVAFFLSAFLTAIAYSSAYMSVNGFMFDSYDYDFVNHFNNRLVVEGNVEGETPESSYDDVGDLLSSLKLKMISGDEEELLTGLSVQPIMPSGGLAFGSEGEEGFYLLFDESKMLRSDLEFRYLKTRVGQSCRLVMNQNGLSRTIAEGAFRGMYIAQDGFLSLNCYCVCPSASMLQEIRESMISLLEEEIASSPSHYSSGPFSRGGHRLICGDRRLSSLAPEDLSSMKNSYASLYGEAIPSGKIYLPESLEEKEFSFEYRGSEISSSSVGDYIYYVPSLLADSEWALENATAKKIALDLGLERSIYFSEEGDMEIFRNENSSGAIMVDAGRSYGIDASQTVLLPLLTSAVFLLSFIFIFLSRFLLRRGCKSRDDERKILCHMGHSPLLLSVGESVAIGVFFLLGSGLASAIYFSLVPNAYRWFMRGLMFFVLAWLLGFSLLPLPRMKEGEK